MHKITQETVNKTMEHLNEIAQLHARTSEHLRLLKDAIDAGDTGKAGIAADTAAIAIGSLINHTVRLTL